MADIDYNKLAQSIVDALNGASKGKSSISESSSIERLLESSQASLQNERKLSRERDAIPSALKSFILGDFADFQQKFKEFKGDYYDSHEKFANALNDAGLGGKNFQEALKEARQNIEKYSKQVKEEQEKIKEIEDDTSASEEDKKQRIDAVKDQYKESETQLKKNNKVIEASNDARKSENKLIEESNAEKKKAIASVKSGFKAVGKALTDLTQGFRKADQAATDYARAAGLSNFGRLNTRNNAISWAANGNFGLKYGATAEDVLKNQTKYSEGVGRNIALGANESESILAMNKVLGEDVASNLLVGLENFGISVDEVAERSKKMFDDATKSGVNLTAYAKNFTGAIKMAQNMSFKRGVEDIREMAKKATELKLDMQQVEQFANRVNTLEGAVQTGAKLQVLGGPFAQFSNPLEMMNEALTDPKALMDRLVDIYGDLGTFDTNTGEMRIDAANQIKINQAADAMGVDRSAMKEMALAKSKRGAIESLASGKGFSEDEMNLIANTATFKNGEAFVKNSEGKDVNIKSLQKGDSTFKYLEKMSQTEGKDIKEIAQYTRSLDENIDGVKTQITNFVTKSDIWKKLSELVSKFVTGFDKDGNKVKFSLESISNVANKVMNWLNEHGKTALGIAGGAAAARIVGPAAVHLYKARKFSKLAKGLGALTGEGALADVLGGGATSAVGSAAAKGAGRKLTNAGAKGLITKAFKKGGLKGAAKMIGGKALSGIGASMMTNPVGWALAGTAAVGAGIYAYAKHRKKVREDLNNGKFNGKYTVKELKQMNAALAGRGQLSDRLKRKMAEQGDTETLDKIDGGVITNADGTKSSVAKNAMKNATINVENGTINLGGNGTKKESTLKKAFRLTPLGAAIDTLSGRELEAGNLIRAVSDSTSNRLRPTTVAKTNNGTGDNGQNSNTLNIPDIKLNIGGSIKLDGLNGLSSELGKELINADWFKKGIVEIIKRNWQNTYTGGMSGGKKSGMLWGQ